MVDYVAETLTLLGPDGKVSPWLAESWTLSPDGTVYTFKLRKGVVFHDGTPFDAKAVKWNFDRLKDTQVRVPIRAPFPIKETEVVDASTVKVTLTRPSAPFISALSWTTSALVSPASVDKQGNEYKNIVHTVGTGPYVFKERKKGESFTVTLNDKYWGKKPTYDTVVFRIVPEAATRESLILAGQVDLIVLPPIADRAGAPAQPGGEGAAGAERPDDLHLAEHDQGASRRRAGPPGPELRGRQEGDHPERPLRGRGRDGRADGAEPLRLLQGGQPTSTTPPRRSSS